MSVLSAFVLALFICAVSATDFSAVVAERRNDPPLSLGNLKTLQDSRGRGKGFPMYYKAGAMIDVDGSGPHYGDPHAQSQTSLQMSNGVYMNADISPYFVLPPVAAAACGARIGDLGIVSYKGRTIAAVYADVGPRVKIGEISRRAAIELGIPESPTRGGVSSGVEYVVFPKSGNTRPAPSTVTKEALDARVAALVGQQATPGTGGGNADNTNNNNNNNNNNGDVPCSANDGTPGTCIDTRMVACSTQLVRGKCAGAANIVCCLKAPANPPPPPQTPVDPPQTPVDPPAPAFDCTIRDGRQGVCGDKTACRNSGSTPFSGFCPGAANIQCCVSPTAGAVRQRAATTTSTGTSTGSSMDLTVGLSVGFTSGLALAAVIAAILVYILIGRTTPAAPYSKVPLSNQGGGHFD